MPIPQEILDVKRPSSTKVKNVNGRYKVIKRTCIRYGGKNYPIELGTVGEIIGGKYYEDKDAVLKDAEQARKDKRAALEEGGTATMKPRKKREIKIDIKECGKVKLCDHCGKGLLEELSAHFDLDTARTLYVIALIWAAYGNRPDKSMRSHYELSVLDDMYPGVHLSPKTLSSFMKRVGSAYSDIVSFQKGRVEASGMVGQIVIDGTLKGFNSNGSFFSAYSRKAKSKGTKDMNILIAFSLETMEPLCSKTYPGNTIDCVAVQDFIKEFNLTNAFLVASDAEGMDGTDIDVATMDKGFGTRKAIMEYRRNKLHYLVALKNTADVIKNFRLWDTCDHLRRWDGDSTIMYKKVMLATVGGKEIEVADPETFDKSKASYIRYMYAFKDLSEIGKQGEKYIKSEEKKGRFSAEKFGNKANTFGLIVFESDLDMPPQAAYEAYKRRWDIEVFVRYSKSIMEEEAINRELNVTVIAENFICLLSETIGCRLRQHLKETGVYKKYSKREVFDCMGHYFRIRADGENWRDYFGTDYIQELAQQLKIA